MLRSDLKAHAKISISWARPHAAWVTLVYLLITGSINFVVQLNNTDLYGMLSGSWDWGAFGARTTSMSLILLAYNLLVSVIGAGYTKYCLQISRNQPGDFGTLFDLIGKLPRFIGLNLVMGLAITGASLVPVVIAVVLTGFSTAFSLLIFVAIVPAIYLTLAYSQAMYFAVDDPGMGILDCLRESRQIMQGRKGEYFILALSFIPWNLLVVVTFGIATLWVTPYMNITYANYFNHLVDYQPPVEPPAEYPFSDHRPPDDGHNQ